jgi:hypothetical protein
VDHHQLTLTPLASAGGVFLCPMRIDIAPDCLEVASLPIRRGFVSRARCSAVTRHLVCILIRGAIYLNDLA